MPKKKEVGRFSLGKPETIHPTKEIIWCHSKHIYVCIDPEAIKDGKYWKQTDRYQVKIKNGNNVRQSGYIYNKHDVTDAAYNTYRKIYEMNYGKEKKE